MHAGIADPPRADSPREQTPPAQCMLGDTANKRAVRILLERILVLCLFPQQMSIQSNIQSSCGVRGPESTFGHHIR